MSQDTQLSLSLFGYNRGQVHEWMNQQQTKYNELEAKLKELEAQSEALSDQVAHYQAMEETLKQSIIDAHVTGEQIIEKSNLEAETIIDQAQVQAAEYKENFATSSRDLATNGTLLKNSLKQMKAEMQEVLDQYQAILDGTDFDKIYPQKQITRMIQQVDDYESDKLIDEDLELAEPLAANSLSEAEKQELERLIQEVMANEGAAKAETPADEKSKLVDFKQANASN
ncbi:DivIVA domain-containing protein [Hutsoniella sourekii]|uniref:DivIVA domain-containing protein n=1 Tax=Hutsoniella sourekii TaxID=87650 RepID=UPI0004BBBCFD|nr:DivIVA domain-containing protein [Hutsoniella sourekii]